ncbi:hypothetical protein V3C99_001474, partial [Haemonchus contortus]
MNSSIHWTLFILIIVLPSSHCVNQPQVITVIVVGEEAEETLELVYQVFAREFGVRFKQTSLPSCDTYTQYSNRYAYSPGQSMVIFIPKDGERPRCERGGNGNVFVVQPHEDPDDLTSMKLIQKFKYGDIRSDRDLDEVGSIYSFILVLHKKTAISSVASPSAVVGLPTRKKESTGIPIPGYVALIVSLFAVVALAVMVKTCMDYRKKSAVNKGLFGASPPLRRSRGERSMKDRGGESSSRAPGDKDSLKDKDVLKDETDLTVFKRRTPEEMLDNPVIAPEFMVYLRHLTRIAIDYYEDPIQFNVTSDSSPGFLYRTMSRFPPENPEPFEDICNELKRKILPGMTHWQHPRFYAYFPAGRPYPEMLAELLTSAMAFNIFSWESCPALNELENTVVNWIGRAFGLPETFLFQEIPHLSSGGGSIVGSASDAIFCSVLVSRNWKITQVKEQQKKESVTKYETIHDIGKRLVAYCSKDAHSCIEKACKVAMVRCRPIQPLQENSWGITGAQLEKHIMKDVENGLIPTHIHCTLGTSSIAADDQLETIWPIAKKYGMWIHCDASYSGNAWVDKKYRDNATALSHVHSINVNLHKFLLYSGMTCLVWTRDRNTYKEAFRTASLQRRLMQGDSTDIREWGIHRSRRNKAMKIWMALRLNGLEGFRYHLNNAVEMCVYFESLVATHPLLKIFSRKLAIFTFFYEEPGSSKEENNLYTENLCQFINQSHKLYVTHTKVHDTDLIRVSISYGRTNKDVIDESWRNMKALIDEFTNRKNDPYLLHTKMVAPLPLQRKPFRPQSVEYVTISSRPPEDKPVDTQSNAQ